jgi:RNA polymerase sigma-70 factor (ECF subfamily)
MTMNDPRQAGDLSAAQLFREHGAFVARFLYRLGVPPQAIDDAVQDVFLVVHQRGGYRPGPAKPTTYLALIASRAASAQRRQQRLRVARQGSTQPDEIHTPDDDPAVFVERRDDLSRLQDALSRLDPALRDTLLLAEFEDEAAPAIARAMGVPVGTVYWRLHEARKKFQRALAVADGSRAQAAARRLPSRRHAPAALSRGAKLASVLGLLSWNEARALFQATRDAGVDFDPGRALQRHLELVAALPAPSPALGSAASQLASGARSGALKSGAWLAAAGVGVLASLQLLQRAPSAAPFTSWEQSARAAPAVAPAQSPAPAATEPIQTTNLPPDLAVAATEAEPRAASRSLHASERAAPNGQANVRPLPIHASSPAAAVRGAPSASSSRAASGVLDPRDPSPRQPAQARAETAEAAPPAPARREQPGDAPADAQQPQSAPRPAASGEDDSLLEARALARADRLLATRPAQALAIVEGLPRTSNHTYLAEERLYIEVMALYGLARAAEANRAADRFLARFGSSVFRERVSAARKAAATAP